jgi:indolepyruvate ferredoxin oxidoreductase
VFVLSAERLLERSLFDSYLRAVPRLAASLSALTLEKAVALADAPWNVRGFEAVKTAAAQELLVRPKAQA